MFAKNLKRIMQEKGITAAELSRLTGYSKSAISQYLNGSINKPSRTKGGSFCKGSAVYD